MWFWLNVALAGSMPTAEVSWQGQVATLVVGGPAGEHVAHDAPFDLSVSMGTSAITVAGMGSDAVRGVGVAGARGQAMTGSLRVSLCEDQGTTCRMVDAVFSGEVPSGRRGTVALRVSPPAPPAATAVASNPKAHTPFKQDAAQTFAAASAEATASDKLMLLDFTAVWCPPCNLMAAEVFEAKPAHDVMKRFVLTPLDVDDPSSFALKDRYAVGGYPTVVVADSDGRELARHVGYLDAASFVRWLQGAGLSSVSDADRAALSPDSVSPEEAASIAWMLAGRGDDGVEAWLPRAALAPESVDLRRARLAFEPTVEDLRWLVLNDGDNALVWLSPAGALLTQEPVPDGARSAYLLAVQRGLQGAAGPQAADLLYMAAEACAPEDAPVLLAAAAASLRNALTGDLVVDRGYLTWLARLTEQSGDVPGALALLTEAAEAFPDEPTFHESKARMLLRANRPEEALSSAESAYAVAWGDNRLRVAAVVGESLIAVGRAPDAQVLMAAALAQAPDPGELAVRTQRYTDKLEALLEGIE